MVITEAGKLITFQTFDEPVVVDAPNVRMLNTLLLGNGDPNQFLLETTPNAHNFVFDHSRAIGSDNGQRAGWKCHSAGSRMFYSSIENILRTPQMAFTDVQALGGYAYTKDFIAYKSLFEASTENVMFGGADAPSEDLIPQDIEFYECIFSKQEKWRQVPGSVKNIFELKNAKRVLVQDSIFRGSWADAQVGFGILLTIRNQDGSNPWATIEDVQFRRCIMRDIAHGISILGTDYTHPSSILKRVTIDDLTIENMGPSGRTLQLISGSQYLTLRKISVKHLPSINNTIMTFDGTPLHTNLVVDGCYFDEGEYGIHSPDHQLGTPTLEAYAPGYIWTNNTVKTRSSETGRTIPYPNGTIIV